MNWNDHSKLAGTHAFLGASQHSWIRYTDEKFIEVYKNQKAKELGTRLHELAKEHIELGIPMAPLQETLCMYINDAIQFEMDPEVIVWYSDKWYGTADTISFKQDNNMSKECMTLRIHDLKTGATKASMEQLDVYAALFCLEYDIDPRDIYIVECIYQKNEIRVSNPVEEDILNIMNVGKHFSDLMKRVDEGEL